VNTFLAILDIGLHSKSTSNKDRPISHTSVFDFQGHRSKLLIIFTTVAHFVIGDAA
jgi:hypothetical protein